MTEIWYIGAQMANGTMEGDENREAGMCGIMQLFVDHADNTGLRPFSAFPCYTLHCESHTSQQRPMQTRLQCLWLWDNRGGSLHRRGASCVMKDITNVNNTSHLYVFSQLISV